ncbi:hypothetical protein LPJ66_000643 [Kickxella alabastrina]|uniref:Uncharacterized protein n=1 Tax=Kickxella alabastrina TaxID=61397 RepID=A0ACC1IVE5_9FUNG|nr:hypothetical protein LPJ66_000643 [Kickxella alabastrina]
MPTVIVYGGLGALGASVVSVFKRNAWRVISVGHAANTEADCNITVARTTALSSQSDQVHSQLAPLLSKDQKVDAILCVAGGWQGGNAASAKFVDSVMESLQQSVYSSTVAASIAARHLKSDGLLALTGAVTVEEQAGTPGMVGYGLAKAAVHQMVASLAAPKSGVEGRVVGILPATIDTPANRAAMPKADVSSWTPLGVIAEQLYQWASGQAECENGHLYKFVTAGGATRVE